MMAKHPILSKTHRNLCQMTISRQQIISKNIRNGNLENEQLQQISQYQNNPHNLKDLFHKCLFLLMIFFLCELFTFLNNFKNFVVRQYCFLNFFLLQGIRLTAALLRINLLLSRTWKSKQLNYISKPTLIKLLLLEQQNKEEMGNFCVGTHRMDIKSTMKMGEGNLKSLRFIKLLNSNKISNICLVYSQSSQTLRALKVMDKVKICKEHCMNLPINEQKILSQLHHPLLVNIVSAFQDESSLYILLEYMPYGSLRNYINSQGLLPEEHVRFVAKCIFRALQYLHSKGIAHFDIKPENILIDRKKYFRLCDFNLSQEISTLTSDSRFKGTPGYKPPQNFEENCKLGFEADYYSTGVVLFELLTGMNLPASCGANESQIAQKLKKASNITPNCLNFVLSLLEKCPSKRLGAKGIQEILDHPWISMEETEKNLFHQKALHSFIRDSYTSKYEYVQELFENRDHPRHPGRIIHKDDDQFVRNIHIHDPHFQKMFASFKTINEEPNQEKKALAI